jgi:hypothetical protein
VLCYETVHLEMFLQKKELIHQSTELNCTVQVKVTYVSIDLNTNWFQYKYLNQNEVKVLASIHDWTRQ